MGSRATSPTIPTCDKFTSLHLSRTVGLPISRVPHIHTSKVVTVQSPVFLTHHRHHVVDSDLTEILKDHDACLKGDGTGCPHALARVFQSHEDGEMHRIG